MTERGTPWYVQATMAPWRLVRERTAAVRSSLAVVAALVSSTFRAAGASPPVRRTVSLLTLGLTLGLSAYVFLLFNDRFLHGGVDFDESHFVWGGWCITKGLVPYKEFLEFKPPFVFLTHALAIKLHGYDAFGYRKLFAYLPLSSLLALQLSMISRGIDKWLALGVVLAIIQLWVNPVYHDVSLGDSESIGLTYYFFAVACLLAKTRMRNVMTAVGGAFIVACIQSKEPFLPCAGLTWISCFLLGERTSTFRKDALRYLKWCAVGGGAVVVALVIYMVPTGSMRAYLGMMRGYFHFYRDPMQSYCVVLGRFHPTTPLNDLLVQFKQARREFLNRTMLGFLVPFGAISLVFIGRTSRALLALTVAGCFFALMAVTASNCQWLHYYNMTMSGLFFFLVVGLDAVTPSFKKLEPAMRVFVRVALLASVLVHIWPRIEVEREAYGTRTYPNAYAEPIPGILSFIEAHTGPADRIFTTGQPALYVQSNRISAIRESAIIDEALGYYEGDTDEKKLAGLRAELEEHRPKVVILDPVYGNRKGRTNRALMFPFLEANGYRKVTEYAWLRPDVTP